MQEQLRRVDQLLLGFILICHIPEGSAWAGQHSPAPKSLFVFVCCLCPEHGEHLQFAWMSSLVRGKTAQREHTHHQELQTGPAQRCQPAEIINQEQFVQCPTLSSPWLSPEGQHCPAWGGFTPSPHPRAAFPCFPLGWDGSAALREIRAARDILMQMEAQAR